MIFVIQVIWSQVAEHRHIHVVDMGMRMCENTIHIKKINCILNELRFHQMNCILNMKCTFLKNPYFRPVSNTMKKP